MLEVALGSKGQTSDSPRAVPRRLLRAGLHISLVLILALFLQEAISSGAWLARLQQDRINGNTEASHLEDFVAYYAAGKLVWDGRGTELYDVSAIAEVEHDTMGRKVGGSGVLPFFNPPFVAAALAPLSQLDIATFSTVLLTIVLAMVIASGLACSAMMGLQSWHSRLLFWLAYLSFHATTWVIAEIQLSMFLVLGWVGFMALQSHGRFQLSGLALSLVLVKPQMALIALAYLIWKRQWQTLVPFLLVGSIGALISVLVAGPTILIDYPRFALDSTGWEGSGVNADQMFGWNSVAAVITADRSPPLVVVALLVFPTLFLAARTIARRVEPSEPAFLLQGSILIFVTLLVNPHLYRQDLVLLVVAIGLLVAYAQRIGVRREVPIAIAIAFWFIVSWGPHLIIEHGIPVVPLAMALTMACIYAFMQGRTGRTKKSTSEPAGLRRNVVTT